MAATAVAMAATAADLRRRSVSSCVAEASFQTMLAKASVTKVELDCRLLSATASKPATGSPSKVESITVLCEPDPVTATVFIDASYDGDVMTGVANIKYTAGREAVSTYNESLAGARAPARRTTS